MSRRKRGGRRELIRRKSSHFFLSFLACWLSFNVKADERKFTDGKNNRFSWNEHRTLSWGDFKGPAETASGESAAATCCSIGFKVNNSAAGTPELSVYNTFYMDRSWVKEDAHMESILAHEQGHFDLCELYTRKLRLRFGSVDLTAQNAKEQLLNIYSELSNEYESCQQAYERETAHGTRAADQQRWQQIIARGLGEFEANA
ncbi:MAG: DUF922 domain-containing protein [Taibaiella sp.]|nr:DUF922 domain-containing protein [Taibaiella sp.]